MTTYRSELFSVGDLLHMISTGSLEIQPKFQRRLVWRTPGKSYFIDTVLRGIPMPKIYLRDYRDSQSGKSVLQVVDGQQRMSALLDYSHGKFPVMAEHYPAVAGQLFHDLHLAFKRRFLDYEITAEILDDAEDDDVWKLFARLNRYTVRINNQEHRHARFAGEFRSTAYELSEANRERLLDLRVVTPTTYMRMVDAELVSDIIVAISDGISDVNQLDDKYEQYDSDFPKAKIVSEIFNEIMRRAADDFHDVLRASKFHNKVWFYSFAVALADVLDGIPGGLGPNSLGSLPEVVADMEYLSDSMKRNPPPSHLERLKGALTRATSHVGVREIRHEKFYDILTGNWDGRD